MIRRAGFARGEEKFSLCTCSEKKVALKGKKTEREDREKPGKIETTSKLHHAENSALL